jgi:glycosyltransferase involved in cell wall biosynthesis
MRTVVAARGMLSPHALGVKPFKKYLFLTWMRWLSAYAHVIFHATSEVEKTDIQKVLGGQMNVQVVPNLARLKQLAPQAISKEEGVLKLVSVGRIAPEKGTLHGLNALASQKAQIQLDLYGTCYNEAYWNECLQVIAQSPSNIKVNYYGPCPSDEVAAHLAAAHAANEGLEGRALVENEVGLSTRHKRQRSLDLVQRGHCVVTLAKSVDHDSMSRVNTGSEGARAFW